MVALKTRPLSKSEKFLVIVALLAAVSFLYWFLYLRPALGTISARKERIVQLQGEIEKLENIVVRIPQREQQLASLKEEENELILLLPTLQELPEVLARLEQIVEQAPVTKIEVTARELKLENNRYYVVPVEIEITGSNDNLIALLEEVETFLHQTWVKEIKWYFSANKFHLQVVFNLYVMPED